MVESTASCTDMFASCKVLAIAGAWVTLVIDTVFGMTFLSIVIVFSCTFTMWSGRPSENNVCDKDSALAFQLVSPIQSIVVGCPVKRAILSRRLVFHVVYGRNYVYTLLVSSANRYPSRFEAQGCELEV